MSSPVDAPRPGSWLPGPAPAHPGAGTGGDELAAQLAGLPVGEHLDVLSAEHERLHRLLTSIDQL